MGAGQMSGCEHCGHEWQDHNVRINEHLRCGALLSLGNQPCGCMWELPKATPPPPTDHGQLPHAITRAIWFELQRQAEVDIFGLCVDSEEGLIDGFINMGAVAMAVCEQLVDMAGRGELLKAIDKLHRTTER